MTIDVQHLTKTYGHRTVLDVPAFHVGAGEIVGLVGSNGAGKSTFLRLLLDLLDPSTGDVQLGGLSVRRTDAWKKHTGSYLDATFLIDFLTADEYFDFIGSLYGFTSEQTRQALRPFQSFYPDEPFGKTTRLLRDLSLGNAKKIGIIAAMFVRPRLLILDEPFANLDPPSQLRLRKLLRDLHAAYGTTILLSSHDLTHVTDVCRRIVVLDGGRIVKDTETTPDILKELEGYFSG
ncbi:MAG: ABC transporter ATP-binding protein [Rhodothermaceae bacterium]|nr:MAG: ABC transporter ATP-binding protein [Rhodothermaceae bacterium]